MWGPSPQQIWVTDLDTDESVRIPAPTGPRSVASDTDGQIWVHAAFDVAMHPLRGQGAITLAEPALDPEVRHGRDLFYAATDPRMSSGPISCASCHLDGRSDGRTWALISGNWQTPSLAGDVDATAPLTWTGQADSVAQEAHLTSIIPMGGAGADPEDYEAIAAFVNQLRLPNPPTPEVADDVIDEGRLIFAEAGCAECHPPPLYTDNDSHPMMVLTQGGPVLRDIATPTLRGIAATAPYLHNGSAETLDDVLVSGAGPEEMADIEHLTVTDREALVAFLRSL